MAKKPRPYSFDYQAQGEPKRYLLSGIPPTMWRKFQAACRRENVAMRQILLSLVEGWLASRDPKTHFDEVLRLSKRAARQELARQGLSGAGSESARRRGAATRG